MLDDSLEFAAKAARARVQVRPRAPTTATTHHPPNHQQTARAAKCMAECGGLRSPAGDAGDL